MAVKAEEVAARLVEIMEAGRLQDGQKQLLDRFKYDLGLATEPACEHKSGYVSNMQDEFFCKDCGASVPRP